MAEDKPGIPGGAMSLAEEEKALHKGRGKMVAFIVAAVVLLAAGLGYWIVTSSRGEEVKATARELNRLHGEYYRPFWGCALQSPLERYTKAEDLIAKLSKMATGSEKRYATYMRNKCMPQLAPYRTKLDAMPPPAEQLRDQIQDLGQRIDEVRSSWTDFLVYLESPGVDPEATPERVELVAKGWYDYARSRRSIQDETRKALGEDTTPIR